MKKLLIYYGLSVLILISVMTLMSACSNNDEEPAAQPCDGTTPTFTEVNDIIDTSCSINSNCHGSGSSSGPGQLLTYQQIFSARSSIKSAVASGSMPKNATLSAAHKKAIICWIDNGAPNN